MRDRFADPDSPAKQLWAWLQTAPYRAAIAAYEQFTEHPEVTDDDIAELGVLDRYYLLVYLLHRTDALHPWLYARCREMQANPDGYIDLWARFHYKSTFGTFAGLIQEILIDPEITIAIFSFKRSIALDFLTQIKRELEANDDLKQLYPEILYQNPERESSLWSVGDGFLVKRRGNPKEPTLTAWGLIDNMPTSAHYSLRDYDDVVTEKSVTTPDMIEKVTSRWELSLSLGHGVRGNRSWYFGTRYLFGDTYETIIKRGAAKPRVYPATHNGKIDGRPVLMSRAEWQEIKAHTSLSTIACQQLLDPRQGAQTTFRPEWIRVYEVRPLTLNVYIVCDPARTKKKSSDRTAVMVVGMDAAHNRYLLDGMLHRMNLSERWKALKRLRAKWMRASGVQGVWVGYEKYGAEADFDYFAEQMQIDREYFEIAELTWKRDAPDSHIDRVQRLEPHFRNGRFFFPYQGKETRTQREHREGGAPELVAAPIKQVNEEGRLYNLCEILIDEEYNLFPAVHVDGLDALSRTEDMEMVAPVVRARSDYLPAALPAR